MRVQVDGVWPGPVTLQRGWSLAESRPWNDTVAGAQLRLVRGSAGFLQGCVETLGDLGVESVMSPPLPPGARRVWEQADFAPHASLLVMRLEIDRLAAPEHLVLAGSAADLREALRIDSLAFTDFWRFDRPAMLEALRSTPRSVIHVIRTPGRRLAGFAITGVGAATAYLQRIAVEPARQQRGLGRSLVRASAGWARTAGARTLVLNTQADNTAAIGLYRSEGFEVLATGLEVLRSDPPAGPARPPERGHEPVRAR